MSHELKGFIQSMVGWFHGRNIMAERHGKEKVLSLGNLEQSRGQCQKEVGAIFITQGHTSMTHSDTPTYVIYQSFH